MRISTSQIYDAGSRNLMSSQSGLYKLQNQLSTGKKFLSAQDDPVAAAQVLLASQSLAVNAQYADNQANALSQLSYEESQLQAVVSAIQDARELVVSAGNGSYTDDAREKIADELESKFDLLLGLANSTDANGYYLFSGYQGNTRPFETNADGSIYYTGDNGQRLLQVGSTRQVAVSDSGYDIFQKIKTGNGTFSTTAVPNQTTGLPNAGSGVIGGGSVVDISQWLTNAQDYSVEFVSDTQFEILDASGTALSGGPFSYTSGTAITDIPGISFSISGSPQAGDTFAVEPSRNQDIFTTLQNLVETLRTDISGDAAAGAALRNTLNAEMQNIDQALQNVVMVRSSAGARMSEMESLQSISSSLDLQFEARISDLQDIDYADVISRYLQQNKQLEAAQSSFSKISGLSLFNYL